MQPHARQAFDDIQAKAYKGDFMEYGQKGTASEWTIRVPIGFLKLKLSDREQCLLLQFEALARTNPFVWPGNESIAKSIGKSQRTVQEICNHLEKKGWIKRVFADGHKQKRLAIIMRRRIDPKLPAADTPELLQTIERIIIACRNPHAASAEIRALYAQKTAPESDTHSESSPRLEVDSQPYNVSHDGILGDGSRNTIDLLNDQLNAIQTRPDAGLPDWVRNTAKLLSDHFLDDHSLDRYRKELWNVVKKNRPPGDIMKAFKATEESSPTGKIRESPGAFFFGCLKKYDEDRTRDDHASEYPENVRPLADPSYEDPQ